MDSPVTPTIPLYADGKHHGHLRLPYSRDDSAWGSVMIPITVIGNGAGPVALFTGGNHGDEYEGPIAIQNLAQSLDPAEITGSVILLPSMNHPAFRAGTRTSPIDKGNLNRLFPGRPDGTVTQKIADFVTRQLLPAVDLVCDIHSGGKTLDFLPFAAAHLLDDKAQEARCHAAMQAFGAPYSMQLLEIDAVGMFDTTAEALGKTFVTTELGGGGTATARSAGIAKRGLRNLLIHAGILNEAPRIAASRQLDMPDGDCFTFSEEGGMIEPLVDLGETVSKGQPLARIWPVDRSGRAPKEALANRSGLLTARHFPGLVQPGDCLAVVAVEIG